MNTAICGHTDPDPVVEQRAGELREGIGAPPDTSGCGREFDHAHAQM